MSKSNDAKKSPSSASGGGAAAQKPSAPAASGAAPAAGSLDNPPPSGTSNPESASAAPGATDNADDFTFPPSLLGPEERELAEAKFRLARASDVHDYRFIGGKHVLVLAFDDQPPESKLAAASPQKSPLDDATRKRAAELFEGLDPDTIWGYREYDDKHVVVVSDGVTVEKFEAAK